MAKTKYGDIFESTDGGKYRYFQLVESDMEQLNSDVIAVFEGTFSQPVDTKSINKLPVDFFTHTTVSAGMPELWKKIDNQEILLDTSSALFKDVDGDREDAFKQPADGPSNHWKIWSTGQDSRYVGEYKNVPDNAELGLVFSPTRIKDRLFSGFYGIEYYNIQE